MRGSADDLLIICKDSTKAGKWMQNFPTIGPCTSHESQVYHKSIAKYCFDNNISKLEVTMLAK